MHVGGRRRVNHGEDVTVAARDALREMIDHLSVERGFRPQQAAYVLYSEAVQLRISALPDDPNASVTTLLPPGIFDGSRDTAESHVSRRLIPRAQISVCARMTGPPDRATLRVRHSEGVPCQN